MTILYDDCSLDTNHSNVHTYACVYVSKDTMITQHQHTNKLTYSKNQHSPSHYTREYIIPESGYKFVNFLCKIILN